jgi:hypothetical protein
MGSKPLRILILIGIVVSLLLATVTILVLVSGTGIRWEQGPILFTPRPVQQALSPVEPTSNHASPAGSNTPVLRIVISTATPVRTSPDNQPTDNLATFEVASLPSATGQSPQPSGETPTKVLTATPIPETPTPVNVNEISVDLFLIMSEEVKEHVRQIHAKGIDLGREPRAFSKLGASVTDTFHFLGRFDTGPYDLAQYNYLQPTIDRYSGSFERDSVATVRALHAEAVFDPLWATQRECKGNESVIECEMRIHNPSIMIVFLGTNDLGPGSRFEENMSEVIEFLLDNGVVPILTTKADRFEGEDNRNNLILETLAAEYLIPLWDYDRVAQTIPGKGLGEDDVHMTFFDQYDYTLPKAFETGYGMFNLTALMMLDAVWQATKEVNDS